MKSFLRNNGLSIVFFILFLGALAGQFFTGHVHHNDERKEEGQPHVILNLLLVIELMIKYASRTFLVSALVRYRIGRLL